MPIQISSCRPGQPDRRLRQRRAGTFRLKRCHQLGQQNVEAQGILGVQPAVNLVHLIQNRLQCLNVYSSKFRHVQPLLCRRLLILYCSLGQQCRPGNLLLPDISRLPFMYKVHPVNFRILFTDPVALVRQPCLKHQQPARTDRIFLFLFSHIQRPALDQQQIIHPEGTGKMPVTRRPDGQPHRDKLRQRRNRKFQTEHRIPSLSQSRFCAISSL
ncbi:hypothetical protein D3C80_1374900 [compost metagenome]